MAVIIPSQVRIANRALILLGSVERLSSFDDPSPLAGQINDLWFESRQAAIVAHPWNFALFRRQLNASGDAPVFGYARQFCLPEDCLRWLPSQRDDPDGFDGEEENGVILTDSAGPINIRYIRDVEDVRAWPPHFRVFMAYQLAMDLAESATQMQSSVDDMADKREAALSTARGLDALASGNRQRGNIELTSRWLGARRSYDNSSFSRIPVNAPTGSPIDTDPGDLAGLVNG